MSNLGKIRAEIKIIYTKDKDKTGETDRQNKEHEIPKIILRNTCIPK